MILKVFRSLILLNKNVKIWCTNQNNDLKEFLKYENWKFYIKIPLTIAGGISLFGEFLPFERHLKANSLGLVTVIGGSALNTGEKSV
jgi:hypothetical protein